MAAPTLNKTSMQYIPRLTSNKADMNGKLLRRPRAPKRSVPPPERIDSKMTNLIQPDQLQPGTELRPMESAGRISPVPSRAYSLVSPPPPSEATHKKSVCYDYPEFKHSMQNRGVAFITKDDKKYVLDPVYTGREKTMTTRSSMDRQNHARMSQTAESNTSDVIRMMSKCRGSDPLPARTPRRIPEVMPDYVDYTDDARYIRPPDFTLENFLYDISEVQQLPLVRVKKAVYSKHNYIKIIELLKTQVQPQCDKVKKVTLTPEGLDIPVKEPRIPQRQLLIELAAVIKQHVRETMNAEVKSVIRPLPKYTPNFLPGTAPHTEIILYEDSGHMEAEQLLGERQASEMPTQDSVFPTPQKGYFNGAARSGSPFMSETVISPSEIAVLDSLVSGGTALSLKAHFICILPDVSPMINTITYLNLSFNDFTFVPSEITSMERLEVLKLRNNPITEIPEDVHKMTNLRVLVASFCLIDTLPDGLCSLKNLVHLNLAYNKLQSLPATIGQMSALRELSVEGNQLPALPRGALRLNHLKSLNVKNNFMHPLFWKDFTQDQPQRLLDLTCLAVHRHQLTDKLESSPEALKTLVAKYGKCDCCGGPLFGPGLRIIRPVEKIFGIKYLPFMFMACTSQCKSNFMTQAATVLSDSLYNVHDRET